MVAIGPAIISDGGENWQASLDIIRRMRASIIRCRTPTGFGFSPLKTADLIDAGVSTIILCTEDAVVTPEQVEREIVGRGFYRLIEENPAVTFLIEIGNEPDADKGLSITKHRADALATLTTLKPRLSLPNLLWTVGLPTKLTNVQLLLTSDVRARIDCLAPHKYGWTTLDDSGGGEWDAIIDYCLKQTTLPLYLSEAGIDDRKTARPEKARRILDWAENADARIKGVCVWGLGEWRGPGRNETMEIDQASADVYGARAKPLPGNYTSGGPSRYFPETGYTVHGPFLTYWDTHGGLPQQGYPISDLRLENGLAVQWFERARFEWHPDNPPEWRVLLGLLGHEVLALRAEIERLKATTS